MKHGLRIPITFVAIVTMTVAFASMKPPSIKTVALSSHVEAVQPSKKAEPVNVPAPVQESQDAAPAQASQPIEPPAPTYAVPSDHVAVMAAAGIAPGDYEAADYILSHESGWCPYKHEGQWGYCPASPDYADGHAYGYCQALPGTKMVSAGDDWLSNPATQMRWCNSYAIERYGGWQSAYAHWIANGNW